MMKFVLILIVFANLLLSACSSEQPPQSARQSAAGGGGNTSLVAAAQRISDLCSVVPDSLAAKIVPNAFAPGREQFPLRCTLNNGKSVLEVTLEKGFALEGDPLADAEFISGLAQGGYLQRPVPDSAYLAVLINRDPKVVLYVEVAGHDGKDHRDDAIAVAREILARWH